jgi:hypothetical protein
MENVRGSQREVASSLQIRIGVWDYEKEDIEKTNSVITKRC